jgi:hypothetical protein
MGYTTKFTGAISLSRKLTFAEARQLLELRDDPDKCAAMSGLRNYLQWVPTESLDAIVWDGEEKFYEYVPLMKWLCGSWLTERGISANGELMWSGEDSSDVGQIIVKHNAVEVIEGRKPRVRAGKPLTMERLGELALDQVTESGA